VKSDRAKNAARQSFRTAARDLMRFSLRLRLIITLTFAVALPLVVSGYVLIQRAEAGLLQEKENKLYGIARTLDAALPGDYDSLLPPGAENLPRADRIRLLNEKLAPVTEEVVAANPGVGAGYYSLALDAMITYGPSSEYGSKIGEPIAPDHRGREVMARGVPITAKGQMVRGNILNAMVPLIRQGRVIGYAWANELTESIDQQIRSMETVMYLALGLALLVGFVIVLVSANYFSGAVNRIIFGLRRLRSDLAYRLAPTGGEFGEITTAINDMAASLQHTRSHTEIVMESMADGIISIDNDGNLTALNKAAARITGWGRQIIGKKFTEIFAHDVKFVDLLMETLHTGKNFIGYELVFPRSDGSSVPLSISTSMLQDHGRMLGAVVVFKDLTERRVFEDRVRRVDRLAAIGELAAGVAHEIRNPLSAISGSVQILLDELPTGHPSRQFGDVVIKEITRLNGIVEDLLYFAKPSKNFISSVHPHELIQETISLLTPSLKKDLVVLQHDFHPDVGPIMVDPALIKQVLVNLLLNAVQALPAEGGVIAVETRPASGGVAISVHDTGLGIKPEDLPRIFDPFFTTKDRGTGLGLAVSSKIIEIHHGYLQVESQPGMGSTFTVFLPQGA